MSNEVILCVWNHLTSADVIYSFSNLNTSFNLLLIEFHGLYKKLDLRHCSLSECRFFCRQVTTMIEWRLDLTVLKIGNRYRCSQTDMFADEIRQSIVAIHFARSGIACSNPSKDIFHILMIYIKSIEPIFPQLASLVVFQSLLTSEEGFELKYEHTIMNAYVPHCSLISITINVPNLTTLHVLLHYLPQLEYVDVYITDVIYSMKTNDEDLPTKLDYPKKLRVLHLRLRDQIASVLSN
ncbi:unnamed protein product [Rotaria socialis]|uniref:F-box domain-containing protein n=1 Tax=Rotaria socialis TaxID=392032 RepID=A0A820R279_9BILA|nr:unnamed protein product [Rotaria socialis]CAF4434061.1 unnamed protein product [Rotaria socialis]